MSNFKPDTYFFSPEAALISAKQQNQVKTSDPYVTGMQICYYDGVPLNNAPENCINLPCSDLFTYLVTTKNRLPSFIDFSLTNFSKEMQASILNSIQEIFNAIDNERNRLKILYPIRKELQPDFSNGLRFFLLASKTSQVLQHVSMNIANALKKMGYPVFISMEENDMQQLHSYHYAKDYLEFKPNVVFNISNFNNNYLHDEIFNFVWIQDPLPIFFNDEPIPYRKRDIVLSLIQSYKILLEKKNISSTIQPFLIDTDIYKERVNIPKRKKIVFIGSSYGERIEVCKKDNDFAKVFNEILEIFEAKSYLTDSRHEESDIKNLMNKYNKTEDYINRIYGYIHRDYCVEKLCMIQQSLYDIEIYGYGWENNNLVQRFYKGKLKYGEDISKIYNSATFGYCPGGYVLMQRTLECACSGTIPLVLDV